MKICIKCKEEKEDICFVSRTNICKICKAIYNKKYFIENKDEVLKHHKAYRVENKYKIIERNKKYFTKDKTKERKKEYYIENIDKIKNHKKEYYIENIDKIKEYRKKYCFENKNKILEYQKEHYIENKNKILEQKKEYYTENKDKINERQKKYRIKNKDKIKEYHIKNKEKINEHEKLRRQTDFSFKLRKDISRLINLALIKFGGSKNGNSCLVYLDWTIEELRSHLESQFAPWMNWNNHGNYNLSTWKDDDSSTWTWQLDHIIPQSILPYTSMEDENFKKCWALSNLRPLSAKQNILDGNRRK